MQSFLEDKSVLVEAAFDASPGRRSGRIHAEFWVQIRGVEARARRRSGDLSSTGIFVNTDAAVGSPGDLVELEIQSVDQLASVATPARICRVVRQDDVDQGAAVIGAGFEFLQTDGIRPRLVALLNHVATHELLTFGSVRLDKALPAMLRSEQVGRVGATVKTLGSEFILLNVARELPANTELELEIPYGDQQRAALRAKVVRCTPQYALGENIQYGLLVRHESPAAASPAQSETPDDVIQRIVSSLVVPADVQPTFKGGDLLGQLSHVRMPSLLSLLETERLSGTLTVANAHQCITLEVEAGRVVNLVSSTADVNVDRVLTELQRWPDGDFRFRSRAGRPESRLNVVLAH